VTTIIPPVFPFCEAACRLDQTARTVVPPICLPDRGRSGLDGHLHSAGVGVEALLRRGAGLCRAGSGKPGGHPGKPGPGQGRKDRRGAPGIPVPL